MQSRNVLTRLILIHPHTLFSFSQMDIDKKTVVNVRCDVSYLSFSAHADAKGIMQLIKTAEPSNVMLVHGEGNKMKFLKTKIEDQLGIPVFMPPNHRSMSISTTHRLPVNVSAGIMNKKRKLHQMKVNRETGKLMQQLESNREVDENEQDEDDDEDDQELSLHPSNTRLVQRKKLKVTHVDNETNVQGVLVVQQGKPLRLMDHQEAWQHLNVKKQTVDYQLSGSLGQRFLQSLSSSSSTSSQDAMNRAIVESIASEAQNLVRGLDVTKTGSTVQVRSLFISIDSANHKFNAQWEAKDDSLAGQVLKLLET
eukprot:TRINITY_DN2415_c0_g1_i5.p1 TRINITY_DN2415_c0_g1~~TRINITY_DN2415_c0_g1_i5.p1  ORF type:complete len:310 (-),score=90.76 TRINITY_DN2415_c0_g1_i5:1433-2362(-)